MTLTHLACGLLMPTGIFTATGPVEDGITPTPLLSRTDIDGVSMGERWATLEPHEHTTSTDFVWTDLDAEIRRVVTGVTAPKIILIRNGTAGGLALTTPDWVLSACRTAGTSNFSGGHYTAGSPTITGNWASGYNLGGFKSCDYGKVVQGTGIPSGDHTLTDGVFTNEVATFTSATAKFTVGDVGKVVSATFVPSGSKIIGISNATTATLSANATGTGRSQSFTIMARDTTILTVTNSTTVDLSRAPTVTGTNKLFKVIGRNFITHADFVQGVMTNVQVTQPVPWDVTYNTKKKNMIQAVGDHLTTGIGSSPAFTTQEKAAIKLVAASYLNMNTEDHFIIASTTPDAPFPDSEVARMQAAGYDTATMIQTAEDIVTATMNAYPNCVVTVAIGSNTASYDAVAAGNAVPPDPDVANFVDRTVKNWARAAYPSRYSIQKNSLAEKNPAPPYSPGTSFYMIWNEGDGYSGEQMLWNCYNNMGGAESTCRNSSPDTTEGMWTDGVYNGTKTITSATANFTASDIGQGISGTGIPANATITGVQGLNSTTFTSTTAKISAPTTLSGMGNMFTIADRICDPAKVLNDSLTLGISKHDQFIEVYQPDCLFGVDQTTIAHNAL